MTQPDLPKKLRLSEPEKGVIYALMAHLTWGGMALYFGLLRDVSPAEIAVNRGLWSVPCAALVVWWLGEFKQVWKAVTTPRILLTLALTSSIIIVNWTLYVWSIEVGRTLESSLGYFINPLLNVVVGYVFLGERFTRLQLVAILLAIVSVLVQAISSGVFPWLGLVLASTFCLYGFLRKTIPVGPTQGFFIEVCISAGPLLLVGLWLKNHGELHFGSSPGITLLLIGSGVLTATALIFYAASIKRLRYSTAGLLQYLSPSLVFLTAVFVFHEPMNGWRWLSFTILWCGLVLYSASALRQEHQRRNH